MAKRPLEIDMCSSSQLRDTQGEMLNVEGADISELELGKGRLNDNHGKGFFNCLGKVTAAKKIFKAEDCDDDRQRYYWEKVKSPYIYVKGVLFDDEDHPNAKAAAAILRNIHKSDCPLKVKASVEGGVVSRGISDPALLARTKIHSVALTFVPANQATLVEPLNLNKSECDAEADAILIKSVLHLAETNVPSFRHIVRDASAERIENNVNEIMAALGAEDRLALKQELIKNSLESKIADNVHRIHQLVMKAVPGPDEHYYNIKQGYTGKDAKKAQINAVKQMLNKHGRFHKPFKTMVNESTGKPELHMVVHRGVDGPLMDPTPDSKNKFRVTPTHIEQPGHAVHAMSYGAAHEYTGRELEPPSKAAGKWHGPGLSWQPTPQREDRAHPESGIYSMWVPVSQIETTGDYMARRFKNPNMPLPDEASGERERVDHNGHAYEQGHITIKPGRYKRVTKTEMQAMHNKWHKNFKNRNPDERLSYHEKYPPLSPQFKHLFPDDPQEKLTYEKAQTMKKGLTAGYGGAGAPGSLTGGGVMQGESLGPKKLSFITCDDCGKEQVYGKYQVKCRDCGKAFSMAKLEKFFQLQKSKQNTPEEQAKIDDFLKRKASGQKQPPRVAMGSGTKGHLPPQKEGSFHGEGATTSGKIIKKGFAYENKETGERQYGSTPQQEKHHWSWDHKNRKWNHIRTTFGSPTI